MEFPLKTLCINRAITFRIASPRWSISINKNHCPCQHEFHKAEIIPRHAETDTITSMNTYYHMLGTR